MSVVAQNLFCFTSGLTPETSGFRPLPEKSMLRLRRLQNHGAHGSQAGTVGAHCSSEVLLRSNPTLEKLLLPDAAPTLNTCLQRRPGPPLHLSRLGVSEPWISRGQTGHANPASLQLRRDVYTSAAWRTGKSRKLKRGHTF